MTSFISKCIKNSHWNSFHFERMVTEIGHKFYTELTFLQLCGLLFVFKEQDSHWLFLEFLENSILSIQDERSFPCMLKIYNCLSLKPHWFVTIEKSFLVMRYAITYRAIWKHCGGNIFLVKDENIEMEWALLKNLRKSVFVWFDCSPQYFVAKYT